MNRATFYRLGEKIAESGLLPGSSGSRALSVRFANTERGLMRRLVAIFVVMLAVTSIGFGPADPASATPRLFTATTVIHQRDLVVGIPFTPGNLEHGVKISAMVSTGASAPSDNPGDEYAITAVLKRGNDVVAIPRGYVWETFMTQTPSNVSKVISTPPSTAAWFEFSSLEANLEQGQQYTVEISMSKNGVALTSGTDYVISNLSGNFYQSGDSITATSDTTLGIFFGDVCVTPEAIATVATDVFLRVSYSDTAGNTYSVRSTPNWHYASTTNTTNQLKKSSLLDAGLKVSVAVNTSTLTAGELADLTVSVKADGSSTELASNCFDPPATPVLTNVATGLEMSVVRASGQQAACYLALASSPEAYVAEVRILDTVTDTSAKCKFEGLKRTSYVGWYIIRDRATFGTNAFTPRSAMASAVTYQGGNSTFASFTGETAGTGQGSIVVTPVPFNSFDFRSSSSSQAFEYFGASMRVGRSSDGNGGMLVASNSGAEGSISLRRLTPTGQDMTFASDGTAEISVPLPTAARPSVGWYGPNRDKWVTYVSPVGALAGTWQIAYGDYGTGTQGRTQLGISDLFRICNSTVTEPGNTLATASLTGILSLPTAEPSLSVECQVRRTIGGANFTSKLQVVAKISSLGELALRYSLSAEPTDAKPCSITTRSEPNSQATGSDLMIASYQLSYVPTASMCSYGTSLATSMVTERAIFRVLANTTTTSVSPDVNVFNNSEAFEKLPDFGNDGTRNRMKILVSGSSVYLLDNTFAIGSNYYKIAKFDSGTFGDMASWIAVNVRSQSNFLGVTKFAQIPDFSENNADSVLLLRTDIAGAGTGISAARVRLSDGAIVSYRQLRQIGSISDGFSALSGTGTGGLNFYGISAGDTAVVGTWATSGEYDPELASLPINQNPQNTGVTTVLPPVDDGAALPPATNNNPGSSAPPSPYLGPVVSSVVRTAPTGASLLVSGTNLKGITKIQIANQDVEFELREDGTIEIKLPIGITAGTYDMVVTSSYGNLTAQGAVVVEGETASPANTQALRPSAKKFPKDHIVKVRVFNVVGAGKVQIFVNDREAAWVNALDESDPKLFKGYLVRTLNLVPGKTGIEVFVDGVRVQRWAHWRG